MNEEKKTSQMKSSAGEYTAPKVEVMELRYRSVICASNEEYDRTNEDW